MGRGGRSRTQRRHFRQNRENVWKRSKSEPSDQTDSATGDAPHRAWEPFATQNPMFDEYYKEQRIVSAEEWDSFTSMLRTPLPAAFRINSNSQFYKDIRSELENDFMVSLQAEAIDGGEVDPIRPLPWYPHNLAWHSNFSRMQLRKNQSLERFHEFLKLENEIGNITRQEAVSMVPPLFLDVSPDHFVLDMCAAPGSKTFQLLETVYQSCKPGCLPSGLIVANDVDVQRCNLLIHQTKRMCTANLIVTNHEAQHFPGCCIKNNVDASGETVKESGITQLQFDRVLCDVPCSGDGTLRKAPDIWRKWNAGMGNGVHNLQVQIAMRGLSLLKVGGRMVYSTCSMNPVENEAVVSEMALRRRMSGTLILYQTISSHRRWHSTKKVDFRKLRPMILERIQNRAKDYPIKAMIPVAQEVLQLRTALFHGVSSLIKHFPIIVCKFCSEIYIGEEGHLIKTCSGFRRQLRNQLHQWVPGGLRDILVPVEAFHLRTMFQEIIKHEERFDYERIPAVVELCCQAGANPVPSNDLYSNDTDSNVSHSSSEDLRSLAEVTLNAWESLRHGVKRLLLVYPTKVCAYCSEVHVGPSGHLMRNCGMFKFQSWRGTHYWKKAEVDDLVPSKLVWRRRTQDPLVLVNEGRDFYGHAPAVVDLCSKAGAPVPIKYNAMMKIHGLARPSQYIHR